MATAISTRAVDTNARRVGMMLCPRQLRPRHPSRLKFATFRSTTCIWLDSACRRTPMTTLGRKHCYEYSDFHLWQASSLPRSNRM